PSSIPCFTASARYEIEWRGKKLVGSAQRRFRNQTTGEEVVLQHGSILTGQAHRMLIDYLFLDEKTKAGLAIELKEKTTDISELKHSEIDMNDLARCIRRGFEEEWQLTFTEVTETYAQV
ncbi:MAG: hypothetical protein ABI623_06110, partial [bacterium]